MSRRWTALLIVLLLVTVTCVFGPYGTLTTQRYAYADGGRLIRPTLPAQVPRDGSPSREECLALLFNNHRVESGSHLALALRQDDAGDSFGAIDDETFESLTLELARPNFGSRVPFDSTADRLYYSAGGTAWASRCAGEFGTVAEGTVRLKRRWFSEIAAEVDLVVQVHDAYHPDSTARRRIRRTVTLSRSNPADVARWVTGGS